jgi:DNA repair exonuclease SbcCD ATPase subunit
MELVELEERLTKLENEVKQLHAALSIKLENQGQLIEMLGELLQILQKRQRQEELAYDRPRSLVSDSNASKSRSEIMLERLWPLLKRDYETQGQGV